MVRDLNQSQRTRPQEAARTRSGSLPLSGAGHRRKGGNGTHPPEELYRAASLRAGYGFCSAERAGRWRRLRGLHPAHRGRASLHYADV
jgi:hypothetical protein